jgi:hypothetical protein
VLDAGAVLSNADVQDKNNNTNMSRVGSIGTNCIDSQGFGSAGIQGTDSINSPVLEFLNNLWGPGTE